MNDGDQKKKDIEMLRKFYELSVTVDEVDEAEKNLLNVMPPFHVSSAVKDYREGTIVYQLKYPPKTIFESPCCDVGGCKVIDSVPREWPGPDVSGMKTRLKADLPVIKCPKCGKTGVYEWEYKAEPTRAEPFAAFKKLLRFVSGKTSFRTRNDGNTVTMPLKPESSVFFNVRPPFYATKCTLRTDVRKFVYHLECDPDTVFTSPCCGVKGCEVVGAKPREWAAPGEAYKNTVFRAELPKIKCPKCGKVSVYEWEWCFRRRSLDTLFETAVGHSRKSFSASPSQKPPRPPKPRKPRKPRPPRRRK
ncbi:MAG: hypothetical protein LBF41_00605 [Deltaproteobacteria bacterium]|jgi:uncharacterized OB-fold protein|nr:hypothetical protein [Deltaproteobacteria bacterium]